MENQELIAQEEESNLLILTDENGQDAEFEYLDVIEYQGKEYLFLMPAEEDACEIIIMEIEPVDEENENYLAIEDEELLNTLYEMFKEKYKDVINFAD